MAVLKVWVDPTRADDTGDGLSLGNAKKTIGAGLTVLNGGDATSILNLVNSGTHDWPTSETDITSGAGSDFSTNFGYKIRGVTSAEAAAIVTVAPAGAGTHRMVRFRSGSSYNILENLIFDSTSQVADASAYNAVRATDNATGPVLLRYCANIGGPSGTMSVGERALFEVSSSGSSTETFQLEYCYFQNCQSPMGSSTGYGGALLVASMDHCCGIWDASGRLNAWFNQGLFGGNVANIVNLTNCTIYEDSGAASGTSVFSYSRGAGNNLGTTNCHSNLAWRDSTGAGARIQSFMQGSAGSTGVTEAGTRGYNVLYGGPNIDNTQWVTAGEYGLPWEDPDTSYPDGKGTDVLAVGVAAATAFLAPGSAHNWVMPNGLSIPIIKDLRPIINMAAGLSGVVPGALPGGQTDYEVLVSSDKLSPEPSETVQLTVTLSNTGTAASSVVATAAVPSGLTYIWDTPSQGSYDDSTGIWTIGSMANGASVTLVIEATVDADQGGSSIVFTGSFTSGTPTLDPDAGNNTDSLTLSVVDESDPGDPNNPGAIPTLDVRPFAYPDLELDMVFRVLTTANRVRDNFFRFSEDGYKWREFVVRLLVVPAATTEVVNLGGVSRGKYLLVDSDIPIQTLAGDQDADFGPSAKIYGLMSTDYEQVQIKNPSATDEARVLLVGV